MPKHAVVSLVIGKEAYQLAEYTRLYIQKYANKVEADYIEINEFNAKEVKVKTAHYAKLYLREILKKYDRAIFFDIDIIVDENTENLFDIVPKDKLGIFEEGKHFKERKEQFFYFAGQWNAISNNKFKIQEWDSRYFNTGVMVLSKKHSIIFENPEHEVNHFFEQSYLNMNISKYKVDVFELDKKFNAMTFMKDYQKCNVSHYSGISHESRIKLLSKRVNKISHDTTDIDTFFNSVVDKTRRTYIVATQVTGLGDKLNMTAAIRHYARKHTDEEITLLIDGFVPEIFRGNPYISYVSNFYTTQPRVSKQDKVINLNWSYYEQHQHGHVCQSYCHFMLGNYENDLTMEVFPSQYDINFVKRIIESLSLKKPAILISPTWTMKNRALSREFWQEFANRMGDRYEVISVGSHKDYKIDNVHDLRGVFAVNQIPSVMDYVEAVFCVQTGMLHLAGCNPKVKIVNFSSGEFPSEMHLPYRNGEVGWKCEVIEHDCPIKKECFDGHIGESIIRPMVEENIKKYGSKHDIKAIRKYTAFNYCAKKEDKYICSKQIEHKVLNELIPRWLDDIR